MNSNHRAKSMAIVDHTGIILVSIPTVQDKDIFYNYMKLRKASNPHKLHIIGL